MTEHTKTPWRVIGGTCIFSSGDEKRLLAYTEEGKAFDISKFYEARANAAFIVRACNFHDEIIASAESLIYEMNGPDGELPTLAEREAMKRLQQVINRALEV